MNNAVDTKIVVLLMPPLIAIGAWLGHYFWPNSTDTAAAIGIALAAASAWAIVRTSPFSTRRRLLWIALLIYALVGLRLGYVAGGSLIGWPIVGLSLGAVVGCAVGNVARRAIVAEERAIEGHAT